MTRSCGLTAQGQDIKHKNYVVKIPTCRSRNLTSVCDRSANNSEMMLVAGAYKEAFIYPVVIVKVDGITYKAALDMGAGSSSVSAVPVERMNKRPTNIQLNQIEAMLCSAVKTVCGYTVANDNGKFEMAAKVNMLAKAVLLAVQNPQYEELISKYPHH